MTAAPAAAPPRYISPLRYPGGKARLSNYLADVIARQYGDMHVEVWMEPFAGGLGAGLGLLHRGIVDEVWFCEANPAVAAMWRTIIADPRDFAARVQALTPTLDAFYAARDTVTHAFTHPGIHPGNDADLGLAAFLVNRCSRSGIVNSKAGPIGGQAQASKDGLTARFDSRGLADRIRDLAPFTHRLRYLGPDGISAIEELDGDAGVEDELLMFVDPPYVQEGNRLYAAGMTRQDHARLAAALNTTPTRWLLTYDTHPAVLDWYPHRRVMEFDLRYSANTRRAASEFVVLSANVDVDPGLPLVPTGSPGTWLRDHDEAWAAA